MADTIIGINDKGQKRSFSRISWDLAHDGWVEVVEQPVKNVLPPKVQRPTTGETQKVTNVAKPADTAQMVVDATKQKQTIEISQEQKDEFFARAEGLNAGPIKDYFENTEPATVFDKKAKKPELIARLGEVLNYDVVEFQKIFS